MSAIIDGMVVDYIDTVVCLDYPGSTFDKKHKDDAGYDLTCLSIDEEKYPTRLDLGIHLVYSKIPFLLIPRSSFVKSGWIMANSPGLIDAGYRGPIAMQITAVGSQTEAGPQLKEGFLFQRVAQMVPFTVWSGQSPNIVIITPDREKEYVDTFRTRYPRHFSEERGGELRRGTGGFGSTGTS